MHKAFSITSIRNDTNAFLREHKLTKDYRECPDGTLFDLFKKAEAKGDRKLFTKVMEMCFLQGRDNIRKKALKYYYSVLVANGALFDALNKKGTKVPASGANVYLVQIYNACIVETLKLMIELQISRVKNLEISTVMGILHLAPPESNLPYPAEKYQNFLICDELKLKEQVPTYRIFGIGVPLLAIIREVKRVSWKKLGERVFHIFDSPYPCTVIFRSLGKKGKIYQGRFEFKDTFQQDCVQLKTRKLPLAIDISTQLNYLVRNGPAYSGFNALTHLKSMLFPEGVYQITPYNEDKIPLVIVHGFMSRPYTWIKMLNHLLANEKIRNKYQFWLYAYPTGFPILLAASKLRASLLEAQKMYDPKLKNPNFNKMVVMGHSMGGLLTKTMAIDIGRSLPKLIFPRPIDKLDLNDRQKKLIKKALIFKNLPFVNRLLFLASPHHGSEMTHWTSMKLAAKLINLPGEYWQDIRAVKKQVKMDTGVPLDSLSGVDGLKPENMLMQHLNNFPIQAKFHSIMGDEKKAGKKNGSDGIVEYASSHLPGAASELVIKSGHNVHTNDGCITEVERILMLHLRSK